jgi:hypothetical protein
MSLDDWLKLIEALKDGGAAFSMLVVTLSALWLAFRRPPPGNGDSGP